MQIDKDAIKLCLFDLGGVLYNIDPKRTNDEFIKLSSTPDKFKTIYEFAQPAWLEFLQFEKGEITEGDFREFIRTTFSIEADDTTIDSAWNAMLINTYPETKSIINTANNFFNTALLSNTNIIHKNRFEPECSDFLNLMDNTFYSHEIGFRKPDSEIFNFVRNYYKIRYEEILFFDDSIINIKSAMDLGINAILVNDGSKLSELFHSVIIFPQTNDFYLQQ